MKVYERVIISHLKKNPYWQKTLTVARGTKMSWITAKKYLQILVEKGVVIRKKNGCYKLKDDTVALGRIQHDLEKT